MEVCKTTNHAPSHISMSMCNNQILLIKLDIIIRNYLNSHTNTTHNINFTFDTNLTRIQ